MHTHMHKLKINKYNVMGKCGGCYLELQRVASTPTIKIFLQIAILKAFSKTSLTDFSHTGNTCYKSQSLSSGGTKGSSVKEERVFWERKMEACKEAQGSLWGRQEALLVEKYFVRWGWALCEEEGSVLGGKRGYSMRWKGSSRK